MMDRKSTLSTIVLLSFALAVAGQAGKSDDFMVQVKNNIFNEQIFITTDRDDYIAGEVLWFSSWLTDSQSSHLTSHSNIARIEILNSNNFQVARSTIKLNNGRGYGQVKLSDTLSSGVYKIRAYTNWMRNFIPEGSFEKDISIFNTYEKNSAYQTSYKSKEPLNNFELQANEISADSLPIESQKTSSSGLLLIAKKEVKTREQVYAELQIPDLNGEPELSVAVVPYESVHGTHLFQTITNQSDIKTESSDHLQYKNEYDGYFVSGKLMLKTGKPSPAGITVYFSVPGRIPVFKYARTDARGRFTFKIGLDEKIDEYILQADTVINGYQIIPESSFIEEASSLLEPAKNNEISIPSHISEMSVNAQISMLYSKSALGNEPDTASTYRNRSRFYGKPAKEVFVKQFIQLRNMEEVFFEIIPGVSFTRTGGRYAMQMKNSLGKVLHENPPAMMIDGTIIWDPAIIARMDPADVERIDVVQDQYMVGDCLFNGIVNIVTKTADFRNIPLPAGAIRVQNVIFDRVYEFAAPQHSGENRMANHEPDYRNTLYWNPHLKRDPEGKFKFDFRTSDVTGYYLICIQGFTSAGLPVSEHRLIHVIK